MSASRLERLQEREDKDIKTVKESPSLPLSELKKSLKKEQAEKENYAFLALEDNIWYYRDRQNLPRGPCPLNSLRMAWINGIIDENTIVWGQGLEEWVPIRNVSALPALIRNFEVVVLTWAKKKLFMDRQLAQCKAQRMQRIQELKAAKPMSCCAKKAQEATPAMACLSLAMPLPQLKKSEQ
ncbi:hypothetical protein CYMTET_37717 [Cymbomonas tetramitiformis]|uniref:GYF domain-containing protein n=1 Tax=Cymbomonas tetramitiformis TaxID=36881 RepID=A0AAE0F5P2_9CHLO|nr:hypothetical protein CYMTET_37717 [Cymbomonas tetramitiformis]